MRHEQRGAAAVEAALALPILVFALFAIVELGVAFRDYLTVADGARNGARVAAVYGDDIRSDYLAVSAIRDSLQIAGVQVQTATIRNADTGVGRTYSYAPGTNCAGGDCCDWTPCPNPDLPSPPFADWSPGQWGPLERDVSLPATDRVEVVVRYTHDWFTPFFGDDTIFTVGVEFQIEPQEFSS